MTKLWLIGILLTGCAASSSAPPSAPPSVAPRTESQPTGAAEAQGATRDRDNLGDELAAIDAALTDLRGRLELARVAVKADLQQQLATLQVREDELRVQLSATQVRVKAEAERARQTIRRAAADLKVDVMDLADDPPR